ncbi:MAG: prepilin-type N-terminal cleavage/methylation domain-containing protein [Endomicrobiaceae bacterium]|jgi:prepilin-type N-terminal cleavage/methylation domain-containing protein|nr:prepilin-type N-terminal cleavage/methylation domain-containing protein [Endomicrobiaceae bacterium]MDD3730397.1 prepilin-type N-terminal cleavage/methylation domain-containing protein [Endomicrobiaceae bacterium]MDD4166338.1 prepilin-type N-terminal cleavage/methylation domain-containing protein [Endomicrobiaceae bacterium]
MKTKLNSIKGFTLVELLIVFAIIGILSLNSIVAYRKFVKEAIVSEGKMLVSSIAKIEKLYHAESGKYQPITNASYNEIPEIDARFNKYFKNFSVRVPGDVPDASFTIITISSESQIANAEVILHVFANKSNILVVNFD